MNKNLNLFNERLTAFCWLAILSAKLITALGIIKGKATKRCKAFHQQRCEGGCSSRGQILHHITLIYYHLVCKGERNKWPFASLLSKRLINSSTPTLPLFMALYSHSIISPPRVTVIKISPTEVKITQAQHWSKCPSLCTRGENNWEGNN